LGIKRLMIAAVVCALLIGFFVGFQVGVTLAQTSGQPGVSMTSEAVNGQYRMVISGPTDQVNRICAQGDCSRTFGSPLDATNYFYELFGRANGIFLVPIPPPSS